MNCYMEALVPQVLVNSFGDLSIILEMVLYVTWKREDAVLVTNARAVPLLAVQISNSRFIPDAWSFPVFHCSFYDVKNKL